MHICVYINVYIYVYICMSICVYVYVCMYIYIYIYVFIYMAICICTYIVKVKLVTLVKGDLKDSFSIATTPRCKEKRYSFPLIAPSYP